MPELYISGSLGYSSRADVYRERIHLATTNRLLSLHGDYLNIARKWLTEVIDVRETSSMKILFDSGAFSAWSKQQEAPKVNELLRLYKSALKFCEPKFKATYFISLDVIPGSPGRTASEEEINESIKQSDINHRILAAELGNRVLPVFHQSEPLSRLSEVVALNPEYICVSPRNDVVEKERRFWSQRVHAQLNGIASHGLAATGAKMMLDVPWRSVDSATWVVIGAMGGIMLPVGRDVKSIQVSEHSSSRRDWFKHVDTMTYQIKDSVVDYCERLGLTYEELRTKHGARSLFNIAALAEAAKLDYVSVPFAQTLFEL